MASTLVSTVWIEILRAQRPVRYAYLVEHLPELSHNQRGPALHVGFRLGYLERTGKRKSYEYSISPRCTVPPGIEVREILEATT
ncbi:hypothetical protein J2W30_003681 [Variovorax boronicumulans]|uniref:hypothetical protein n=1 Tax=Variovorax boronicumulans TaxID=436515 RepID=UPI0027882F9B|nr:hypothetical protein [Variovorax boronicumulans]MDQ0035908.1 hypothetical protein [Variovorax boronicumulans]